MGNHSFLFILCSSPKGWYEHVWNTVQSSLENRVLLTDASFVSEIYKKYAQWNGGLKYARLLKNILSRNWVDILF